MSRITSPDRVTRSVWIGVVGVLVMTLMTSAAAVPGSDRADPITGATAHDDANRTEQVEPGEIPEADDDTEYTVIDSSASGVTVLIPSDEEGDGHEIVHVTSSGTMIGDADDDGGEPPVRGVG